MIRTSGDRLLLEEDDWFIPRKHQVKYGGQGSGKFEWDLKNDNRIFEPSWESRYQHEAKIISNIIKKNNFLKILELGSGPGKLADIIQNNLSTNLKYDLVDKPNAKSQNKKYNLKCNKFV